MDGNPKPTKPLNVMGSVPLRVVALLGVAGCAADEQCEHLVKGARDFSRLVIAERIAGIVSGLLTSGQMQQVWPCIV